MKLIMILWVGLCLICTKSTLAQEMHSKDEIILGQSASFSGSFLEQAAAYRDGALLYFDELNRRGGVHGRKVRLVSLDDKYNPELAVANTKKLIEEYNATALIHYTWTPIARAVIPIASQYKVPFFAPYTGANDVYRSNSDYVFTVRASFQAELEMLVRHLTTIGIRNIAVIRYTSKTGDELLNDLQPLLKKFNATLVGIGKMENNSARPDEAIAGLANVDAQAIILGVSGADAVAFINGFHAKTGRPLPYFARSLVGAQQLSKELGDKAYGISITQLVPNPHKQILPINKEYSRLLAKTRPGAKPDFISFEGYIAAKVISEALMRTGPKLDRSRLHSALSNLGKLDLGGFEINFKDGSKNGSEYVGITMIGKNGRIID